MCSKFSMIQLVRNPGDPVPFQPPVPDIPLLIDSFYHVGFGVTLQNMPLEMFEIQWPPWPWLAKLIRLGQVVISPVMVFTFLY